MIYACLHVYYEVPGATSYGKASGVSTFCPVEGVAASYGKKGACLARLVPNNQHKGGTRLEFRVGQASRW